jgi:hypothetical protein
VNVSCPNSFATKRTDVIAPNPTKMMLADMVPSNVDGPILGQKKDLCQRTKGSEDLSRSSVS